MHRIGADDEDCVRVVDLADRERQGGIGERGAGRGGEGAVLGAGDIVGAERATDHALDEVGLFVGGAAADDRRDLAVRLGQAAGGPVERLGPGRFRQRAAAADLRAERPVLAGEHLEAEAALVAEPAVVDVLVVAPEDAYDLLVADRELDVALARAESADRASVLDVPGAGAEAVRLRGERAHGAELDDVAVEGRDVGAVVEGAHERLRPALEELQLLVLGDLLGEPDAAVTEDAALAIDLDQRAQRDRLLEVALGVGDPALAVAPAHRDVLQRALAALVADRAVERVVDEQELDDGVLRVLDPVGLRVDDHAVADRGRAGGLQLRDALDLDQAHAAGADRIAELGLVTEDRDLDVPVLGGIDQHPPLGCLDLDAVDDDRDLWLLGPAHAADPA